MFFAAPAWSIRMVGNIPGVPPGFIAGQIQPILPPYKQGVNPNHAIKEEIHLLGYGHLRHAQIALPDIYNPLYRRL
jgi:hypothetical protein